ncbi:type 1 glutamine amidotransferase [Saccharopolyspora sp. HNM0983]|uniref:Type 1 glutamine amidotransferase n=1 Tax=Saccharopolyspora montiporae TaxID=2781240 RepID=A0A929B7E6_9PSEU|nr:type 1 glutamine amidotransferase [Saccharopolyspora sp. HNM0983]MBE9373195.1 type 1 glutamine amidotransferase [Saccharopolyspora sp. HNM0983]
MDGARVLCVQLSDLDPPARLGAWLRDEGVELDVVHVAGGAVPASLDQHDALVVLGGEAGAYDDLHHSWLSAVRGLLSSAVAREELVLAIGLGAHLLAVATGGQVRAAAGGPERGTLLVAKRDAAAEDPLFGPLPLLPDVLQFHDDEVTQLPPSAQQLAASPKCENQAFRVGARAYGLQFHIETTPDMVRTWADQLDADEAISTIRTGQLDPAHLDEFHADLDETWRPFVQRFARVAATPPGRRNPNRMLPLADD